VRALAVAACMVACVVAWGVPRVHAQEPGASVFVHTVRAGDTLASIAQKYYGDPARESVLVMENGLNTQGGAAIVVGLRLDIPAVAYHRVVEGDTWAGLAERFYGDAHRAFALMDSNGGSSTQPDVGAEILVPYPLRHVAGQHETLTELAQLYYGSNGAVSTLRRGNRLTRGQIILVPLADLLLSDEGRAAVAAAHTTVAPPPAGGEVREQQARIDADLPTLREDVRRGRYAEAVALANHLLGQGNLTGNQAVTIERELGTAYVALDRDDLAVIAFREVIARQPDTELDSVRTSPRVLHAWEEAKHGPHAVTDAGAAPDASVDGGVHDGH